MSGFYGNTYSSISGLQIDKKYASRTELHNGESSDGVFVGRYALVEYDLNSDISLPILYRVSISTGGNTFYTLNDNGSFKKLTSLSNYKNQNIQMYQIDNAVSNYIILASELWNVDNGGNAKRISTLVEGSEGYRYNYALDKANYGTGDTKFRGYDSTLWQKTYSPSDGYKYIMIGDLNAVTPSFSIVLDAPSEIPAAPHFDATGTNIHYNLHMQPNWGIRIASEEDKNLSEATDEDNRQLAIYFNEKWFDSDYAVPSIYLGVDGPIDYYSQTSVTPQEGMTYRVYENKGSTNYTLQYRKNGKFIDLSNIITFVNEQSNREYYIHTDTNKDGVINEQDILPDNKQKADDIKGLKIQLPIIGDTVAKMYDILYGPDRQKKQSDSLQGKLDFFNKLTQNQIPVQSTSNGLVGASMQTNTWITPTVDTSKKIIKIEHNGANSAKTVAAGSTSNSSPNFGSSFTVPYVAYDEKGHIASSGTRKITLPKGSLTSPTPTGSTANVLTSLSFTDTSGALIMNERNVGTLLLTGYEEAENNADIVATDSINVAFGKLQKGLNSIDNTVNGLTYSDTADENQFIYSITQTNGKIAPSRKNLSEIKLGGYIKGEQSSTVLAKTQTLTEALNALEKRIEDEISTLDYPDSTTSAQIVTKVDETDGKITVTHENIGGRVLAGYTIATTGAKVADTDTINGALGKLQKSLDEEVSRATQKETDIEDIIRNLDVPDTQDENQFVYGVSQADGKISVARKNLSAVKLGGYTKGSQMKSSIDAKYTLTQALNALDFRIETCENAFGALDYDDTADTTKFISQVNQKFGKITVSRAEAGTLVLGSGYQSPYSKIASTDSLNSAFQKIETELNTINAVLDNTATEELDSVIELINWVGAHGSEVDAIRRDISANTTLIRANTTAINTNTNGIIANRNNINTNTNDITTNRNNITTLQTKVTSLETEIGDETTGIKKDLIDLREYIDSREITISSEQDETILGTVETILSTILSRVNALEEMCQIQSLEPDDSPVIDKGEGDEIIQNPGDTGTGVPTVPDFGGNTPPATS